MKYGNEINPNSNKFYAGIGSRETPPGIEPMIEEIVSLLFRMGFTLRSGGAPGADSMFEGHCPGAKEIYLPWRGFNNKDSDLYLESINHDIELKAREIAKKYHPNWNLLSEPAKKLMTRNTFQILGKDLQTPSMFIVCWTQGGLIKGGTGQAIRIAKDLEIPIFNLYNKNCMHQIRIYLTNNP